MISSSPTRRGINIYSREGAPVVAVNDGVINEIGKSKKLGNYIVLQDAYGNRFTYAELGEVSEVYPVPKQKRLTANDFELVTPDDDDRSPTQPASAGRSRRRRRPTRPRRGRRGRRRGRRRGDRARSTPRTLRERLYAFPERPSNVDRADLTGQLDELLGDRFPGYETFKSYFSGVLRFDRKTMELRPLKEGSQGHRRHRARPDRQEPTSSPRTSTSRSGRPAAAPRRSTRSRSSTAGSCSRRPRSTAPPARTRSPARRDAPARSC